MPTMRLEQLRSALRASATDVASRCELASLLEDLGKIEDALSHWRQVLTFDPNHLRAWEGVARCRQRLAGGVVSPEKAAPGKPHGTSGGKDKAEPERSER